MCDRRRAGLFGALGRERGLFRDVACWPDLRDFLRGRSAALLTQQGERAWEALGGVRDAQGLGFRACGGPAVAAAMGALAAGPGGFLWADPAGMAWAVRLVHAGGSDADAFGFGLSWPGAGSAPGQARCAAVRPPASGELAQPGAAPPGGARERLECVARGLRLGGRAECLLWATHAAVLAQRSSLVLLPDLLLAQLVWAGKRFGGGRRWPRHWRHDLLAVLQSLLSLRWATFRFARDGWQPRFGAQAVAVCYVEDLHLNRPAEDVCRAACPLHGRGARHGHFLVGVGYGFLGALEHFATSDDGRGTRAFDFTAGPEGKQAVLSAARAAGDLVSVHLPTKLLGAAAGLCPGPRRLLQALVGELVRLHGKKKGSRPDRAALIRGDRVPGVKARTWVRCPLLQAHVAYADFNGNGKRKGRGYRFFGAKGTGWVHKAGHAIPAPDDDRGREAALRTFLGDLSDVAGPFGLTVAGLDPRTGQWLDLEALVAAAGVPGCWRELDRLHVRAYGPEPYLELWRQHLASQANFTHIEGGHAVAVPASSHPAAPLAGWRTGNEALDLALELRRRNVRQRDLAKHLGVSRAFICQVLRGAKKAPAGLLERARHFLAGAASG
jgi:hypothetical protein